MAQRAGLFFTPTSCWHQGRLQVFDEGLYGLTFRDRHPELPVCGSLCSYNDGDALAILRNGSVLGSDQWGGIFSGSYLFDPKTRRTRFRVRIVVPPEGELITGFAAGPDGATLEIFADFEQTLPNSSATVDIAGQPLEIALSFLGPLPN